MSRHSPVRRRASAFFRFERLLAFRDRVADLFRSEHTSGTPNLPIRLSVEAMEDRIVPDGRPLPFPVIFAGAGAGHAPFVKAYDAETGGLNFSLLAYAPSFQGGVRVGTADFNADGIPDVVTAPGPGSAPVLKVFDGTTGDPIATPLSSFLAFSLSFTDGVHVAAADVDGDGVPDVVAAAALPSGSRVKVFSGVDHSVIASFAVPGPAFANSLTVAAADLTGDGKAEVVVGAGPAGGGWVRTYDPLAGSIISGPLGAFRAFGTSYAGGVFVGSDALAGDVDSDGTPDLAVGTGPAFTSRVRVFSGATGEVLHDFLPFGSGVTGGARVALAYVNDDAKADVVVGSGPGTTAKIRVFDGVTGQQLAAPLGQYTPFGNSWGGVFVAATNDPVPPSISFEIWSDSTVALGQVLHVKVDVFGVFFPEAVAPTGTVTFTTTGSGTYTLGTSTLSVVGDWQSEASLNFGSVPAGTYTIVANYSGDSYFDSATENGPTFTVSAPSNAPANVIPGGGSGSAPDILSNPLGAGRQTRGGYSASGVSYGNGTTYFSRSDLHSSGYGKWWGQNWSWTSAAGHTDGISGGGATLSQTPHLVQLNDDNSLGLVSNGTTAHFFDLYSGAYHARFTDTATLTHDSGNGVFIVTDGTGQTFTFYDFSGGTPSGREGKLKKVTDAEGNITEVVSWATGGKPEEVQRVSGTGGSALTESFLYTFVASGTNAGLVETVTQRTKVGTGSWSTVRSTAYTYHDGTTSVGKAGELRTAIVKDASGTTIDTSYYRYYTTGSNSRMKFAFGADAYKRLTTALGTSVDSLTDGQVDDYADKYWEYDGAGKISKVVDAAAGGGSAGQGEFEYTYSTNGSAGLMQTNSWASKTVETLPNGSTNTVYTNAFGQVMLTVFEDSSSNEWMHYYRYDDAGRTILEAGPSVVTGYSESNLDLIGYSSGNATYLDDDDGLVTAFTYASSTTATTSTAGDAAGYLKSVAIKHGETGTAIPQSAMTYIMRTAGGQDFFFTASSTIYRNDDGTGGQTTSTAYTWQGSTAQPASITTTLPTVTTAQNGPNSATSFVTVFDEFGRQTWSKDQGGFISYIEYDTVTGAAVKMIADVDTTQTSDFANLPSGWSTPSGGGLHLITTYEVDSLGRVTKSTSPEGRIDYTVYNDANHEVRSYSGWNTSSNSPTGPTSVSRYDTAGGYSESLTMSATPTVSSGRPTGTESIAQVQSLSRSYTNAAGQMTHSDSYFDISGLTYSTSTSLGTENVNFYRTEYAYDSSGQQNRTETPLGTITRTVHDDLGRAVSQWIGTDDTPTTGTWSPTNTTGTNLVKVSEYEYDGGGVGDGNVTKTTEYPGGGAAARVTQTWFDWRNRGVATKQGVETSESTSLNRPLVYTDFDNLGQVTKTRVYDADTVTPSYTDDVPQPLSSSLLRAQTTTSYDELGRAYRSDTYIVDPSNGDIGTYTLHSDTWFDARGMVIKSSSPGGLVQKMVYDGAGRTVVSYLSDGGGDSGYSDADDVTGDIVLEQSETTFSDDGLPLAIVNRVRFHDASGTGALGGVSSAVYSRVTYAGNYYDASSGRLTATVDVGTNGGTAWTRPGTVPSRSDTVLVTSYTYAADAVQTVKLTGSPTGGTFTLTFGGNTTSGIAYNATAATVDSALEALGSIGAGNVVVTDAAGGGWQVRFAGTLAGKYQSKMTASGAGLTGGSSPSVAISTVSAGGDTGSTFEVTDPKGLVSRSYADAIGRTTQSIENFVDGAVSDGDDKTTAFTYNSAGMTSLAALLTGGGFQTTEWVFGITQAGGNKLDSNDAVGATKWPDPTTGAASSSEQETTTVNALGQTLTSTDRNGNVHTLTYDVLGRITIDAVTTLGSGVDGSVRRIETAYDSQGNAYLITSYDATTSGNVVNQVQREFNGLGQMTKEWQSHSGAVNTSTSPKVQYAWSEMPSGANHSRLVTVTYPNGRTVTWDYGTSSGLDDTISRLSALKESSTTLEGYSYLGMSTVVARSHPESGVDLTYVKRSGESNGDAGDQYIGLDRFGRVVDQRWVVASSGTATDRFQYTYDRNGNRTATTNTVNTAFNETYGYDGFNQLTSFARGSHTQAWDLDAVGNFESVTTDGASPVTRTHNAQNELTGMGGNTLTFDANGNTTTDQTGKTLVYDAWNRLVAVKSGSTTLVSYQYDGLNRRIVENPGTARDLYYSSDWQVLEERVSGTAKVQYVWSPVYVDAMVLRDRDADGSGGNGLEERLYAQQDGNWNVTALVNTSGNVTERMAFDAYGKMTVMDSSWSTLSGTAVDWAHYFQGARHSWVSGDDYLRNREYDADTGRFRQVDPIRYTGGYNLYGFVGNNPLNGTDPLGLQKLNKGWVAPPPSGGLGPKKPNWDTKTGKDDLTLWGPATPIPNNYINPVKWPLTAVLAPDLMFSEGAYKGGMSRIGELPFGYKPSGTSVPLPGEILLPGPGVFRAGGAALGKFMPKPPLGAVAPTLRELLIAELALKGIKHSPEKIVAIGRDASGKIIFLETGGPAAGLRHILERHATDFAGRGISSGEIPEAVVKAATEGKVVGQVGTGANSRSVFEIGINGRQQRIAVGVSDNGYVVTAHPGN